MASTLSLANGDQDGDEIDILVQRRKEKGAAMLFFKRLLKGGGATPIKIGDR